MGRRKKIIVVGLPLFAAKFASEFSHYTKEYRILALDTYYSKLDKLRFLIEVQNADLIFSINGSLTKSTVFDLAIKKQVPIIMNWVGTDVLKAVKAYNEGSYNKQYISSSIHFCEVNWIKNELKEIGVNAEVCNFASFDKTFRPDKLNNKRLKVLSYIPDNRSEFYGIETLINLATKFSNVDFVIAGGVFDGFDLPNNIAPLGWVNDMDKLYSEIDVCIRYTNHDGLSNFVLEGLARGKQVLYNNDFPNCFYSPDQEVLVNNLSDILDRFDKNEDLTNYLGMSFIQENFSKKVIFDNLILKIRNAIGK